MTQNKRNVVPVGNGHIHPMLFIGRMVPRNAGISKNKILYGTDFILWELGFSNKGYFILQVMPRCVPTVANDHCEKGKSSSECAFRRPGGLNKKLTF